ncbi:MAG: Rne/Rng family ribonuclease [Inquilinaceae bacterium]
MAKNMLVDATHPEETRVVVVSGNKLEEFDFETAAKRQLKGNIYLAKVTRVEPSLQAAFVEYGGNRHGFLAFSEIHPDYYRIPVADREALIADDRNFEASRDEGDAATADNDADPFSDPRDGDDTDGEPSFDLGPAGEPTADGGAGKNGSDDDHATVGADGGDIAAVPLRSTGVEVVGGDEVEEATARPAARRPRRHYKIQEVVKRRQIMLVQVTKEERGNKGAALTTYLSLAGRYCVLMPNTPRGGGVSRKIANPKDRKKMKQILDDLFIPEGMAVILRTAGLERTRTEIKRDFDYLLRLWDSIRELTLESTAPTLIHEEANLIKRAIRDLYSRDIDGVHVAGEEGYRTAKDFMRMLMPSHARNVQLYRDDSVPLFHRYQVESQIDAMHSPMVQLPSGGTVVLNPTEALVAIDVNSGRSTRERNIEETAYKTNLEAAEEIARQLRLRDLAGLIVIDFIDMEDDRHNTAVERRLKESMRGDRARIQLGHISPFGLLELSRQRLRPSFVETHFQTCALCAGIGLTRTSGSVALQVLRAIEEEGIKRRAREVAVRLPTSIALYIFNEKRAALAEIEQRYGFTVLLHGDDTLIGADYRLERTRAREDGDMVAAPAIDIVKVMADVDADTDDDVSDGAEAASEADGEEDRGKRKRRSRRGRRRRDDSRDGVADQAAAAETAPGDTSESDTDGDDAVQAGAAAAEDDEGSEQRRSKRRRGRRGGRRRAGRTRDEAQSVSTVDTMADGETAPDDAVSDQPTEIPLAAQADDATDEAPTAMPAEPALAAEPAAEPAKDEAKKPARRRSRKTKPVTTGDESATETVETAPDAKPTKAPAKRRPRRAASVAADPVEIGDLAAVSDPVVVDAPDRQDEAAQDEPAEVNGAAEPAAAVNGDSAEPNSDEPTPAPAPEPERPAASPYQVISEAPERKKGGWWRRVLD